MRGRTERSCDGRVCVRCENAAAGRTAEKVVTVKFPKTQKKKKKQMLIKKKTPVYRNHVKLSLKGDKASWFRLVTRAIQEFEICYDTANFFG